MLISKVTLYSLSKPSKSTKQSLCLATAQEIIDQSWLLLLGAFFFLL